MTVRVFVSSTGKDLPQERLEVIQAVRWGGGVEVAMETWDAPYAEAVDLCLRKIRDESTHYVGVFCYYRGWLPAAGASITEIEFNYAFENKEREHIAVFVPKETAPFASELLGRADTLQDDSQLQAQRAFLRDVLAGGVAGQFETAADLYRRVQHRVTNWVRGPFDPADGTGAVSWAAVDELVRRHFRLQVRDAEDALAKLVRPAAVCILVDGTAGIDQDRLLQLLLRAVEDSAYRSRQPRRYQVAARPSSSRPPGLGGIIASLGEAIYPGWRPSRVAEVTERLFEGGGADRDVVLVVPSLIDYPRGEEGFLAEVWEPLAAAAQSNTGRGRLVCLAVAAGGPPDPAYGKPGVEVLPPVGLYDTREVFTWLTRHSAVPVEEAESLASRLIDQSGGLPLLLVNEIERVFGMRKAI